VGIITGTGSGDFLCVGTPTLNSTDLSIPALLLFGGKPARREFEQKFLNSSQ
jgi:hypothetical protein